MGLKAAIQQATVAAFKAVDDLAQQITYHSFTGAVTRDVVAGTSVRVTVEHTVPRAVFTKFSEQQEDQNIVLLTDEKLMFPATSLPISPKSSDTVTDAAGRTWLIVRRLSDPAAALIVLQVRTNS